MSSGFHKKCKTLSNRTVRNCMLHPWLLYLSAHLKPILFSQVSIMSNDCIWIWICHHICKIYMLIARIYAHVFIYTEYTDKILRSPLSPLYILHHCSLHVCLFTVISLFSFLFLFSLFLYYHHFLYHPKDVCHFFHSPLIDCKIAIRDVFSFSLEPN